MRRIPRVGSAAPGGDVLPPEPVVRHRVWVRVVSQRSSDVAPVELGLRGPEALIWAQQAAMEMSMRGWATEVFEMRTDGSEIRAFRAAPGVEVG